MKIQVLEQKENPLLLRKEIVVSLEYDKSTVSKADLQKKVAEQMKTEPNHVEIVRIINQMGKPSGKAQINVWSEKEIPIYGQKEAKPEEKKE